MTECSNDRITNMLPTIIKGKISLELSKVGNSVKTGVKVGFRINAGGHPFGVGCQNQLGQL